MKKIFFFFFFILVLSISVSGMKLYFNDPLYSFQLLRTMGESVNGAADVGECLKTAYRIKEGDDESWYREWNKTANELEIAGTTFLAKGNKLSASEAYLRASNYYRTAEFLLHGDPKDPRIIQTWSKSRDLFIKSVELIKSPIVKQVKIPFENTILPGYLCLVDNSGKKRPLIIIHSGFDGTKEELYYTVGLPALKRGYNCLLFEGPGQGEVIRVQKIPFRPNWESVVTPVVDFAIQQKEVDSDRLALMGISFGGLLAPRAVAFEKRIKVCVANGGIWDFHSTFLKSQSKDFAKAFDIAIDNPTYAEKTNEDIYKVMKSDANLRWIFNNGMFVFQAKSPVELIKKTRPYKMEKVVTKIECRVLVVDSQKDKALPGQAIKLYNALKCPKEYMLFTVEEGAEEHCQMGALSISNERVYNWLEKYL